MSKIPPTPRGGVWVYDDDGEPDDEDNWVEDEVWRALHVYINDEMTFVVVEGDQIVFQIGKLDLIRFFPLKEALMWWVNGLVTPSTGKICSIDEYDGPYKDEYATELTTLRQLRAVLAEVIAEIDDALPQEQDSAPSSK